MNFSETLKLALDAIWAHKLRSALTLLGMIIGVTAVVVVVSLIQFPFSWPQKIACHRPEDVYDSPLQF
ncbi:MAG: hypothetical protein U0Y68_17570 [Blastocatellia bacterium]